MPPGGECKAPPPPPTTTHTHSRTSIRHTCSRRRASASALSFAAAAASTCVVFSAAAGAEIEYQVVGCGLLVVPEVRRPRHRVSGDGPADGCQRPHPKATLPSAAAATAQSSPKEGSGSLQRTHRRHAARGR
eukprot:157419-Chlamydomonas_euryale.AAC.1